MIVVYGQTAHREWGVDMSELETRIELWKSRLLDTGRRNRMINYRDLKLSTLTITEPGAEELYDRLVRREQRLKFMRRIDKDVDIRVSALVSLLETLSYPLIVEEGDIRTATTGLERSKALKNLRARARLAREEQGIHTLYLCFGFIYWREKAGGAPLRSPLLLVPVTIGQTSLKAPYTLSRYDEDIVVNPTLSYRFAAEFNIELPTFDPDRDKPAEFMDRVEALVDRKGWGIRKAEVSLGELSFTKLNMYQDLELNRDRILSNRVLQLLSGEAPEADGAPELLRDMVIDDIHPRELHEVVDADSSQEEAILLSKVGTSFVMQGPPGTGKSQTITNIIAEALADGRKVLFVSEKAAALQVVFKRLTEVGLAEFCLPLHDHKANKKDIIRNIGANLDMVAERQPISLSSLMRLMEDRGFINAYAEELHRPIEPFGQSIYQVYGQLSRVEKAAYIPFAVADIAAIDSDRYAVLLRSVDDLETALRRIGGPITALPWYGTTATVGNQAYREQLIAETNGLGEQLEQLEGCTAALCDALSLPTPGTWTAIAGLIGRLEALLALGPFPSSWMTGSRSRLSARAREEQSAQKRLRERCEPLLTVFSETVLEEDTRAWLDRAEALRSECRRLGYGVGVPGKGLLEAALSRAEELRALHRVLQRCIPMGQAAAEQLQLPVPSTIAELEQLRQLIAVLCDWPGYVLPAWLDPEGNEQARALLEQAQAYSSRLAGAESELRAHWGAGVAQLREALADALRETTAATDRVALETLLRDEGEGSTGQIAALRRLSEQLRQAGELIGIRDDVTIRGARLAGTLLGIVSELTELEPGWLDIRRTQRLRTLAEDAQRHAERAAVLRRDLLGFWREAALTQEVGELLRRYEIEYSADFLGRRMTYRRELAALREYLREEVGTRSVGEGLEALDELEAAQAALAELTGGVVGAEPTEQALSATLDAQLTAISELERHNREREALQHRILSVWTPACLELDAAGLLARFRGEHRNVFSRMFGGSYRADTNALAGCMKVPGPLPGENELIELLSALVRLKEEQAWLEVNASRLEVLPGEARSRAETEPDRLREELRARYDLQVAGLARLRSARAATDAIWATEPPVVLRSRAIRERFRTQYTAEFLRLMERYDADERCFATLVRDPSGTERAEALRRLEADREALREEDAWFRDNNGRLEAAFGPALHGRGTDWAELRCALEAADRIIACFPHGCIRNETIEALCATVADTQRAGEARALRDSLSADALQALCTELEAMPGIPQHYETVDIDAQLLPGLEAGASALPERRELFGRLTELYIGSGRPTLGDAAALSEMLETVRSARGWFMENACELSRLLGSGFSEPGSDWGTAENGLRYAARLLACRRELEQGVRASACSGPDRSLTDCEVVLEAAEGLAGAASVLFGRLGSAVRLSTLERHVGSAVRAVELLEQLRRAMDGYVLDPATDIDSLLVTLKGLDELRVLRQRRTGETGELRELFGLRYTGPDTDWAGIIEILESPLLRGADGQGVPAADALTRACEPGEARDRLTELVGSCKRLLDETDGKLKAFSARFRALDFHKTELSAAARRYRACMTDYGTLNTLLEYEDARAACEREGLKSFAEYVARADNTIPEVRAAFERGFLTQWITEQLRQLPAVSGFKRGVFEGKLSEFVRLDTQQQELARRRIRKALVDRFPSPDQTAVKGSELAILRHELEKKTKHMPLRRLFTQIPGLLQTLKPCFMMSPLSVAYFLSADIYHFDLVIFDEASQIFPQDAIGAILRGDQVVIAGDTRQMPPTSFFRSGLSSGDDYDREDEESEEELQESILEESEVRLPSRTLRWHYRSRHEHLIAFSNREIYAGRLVTFPSSCEGERDTGVEYIYVPDGRYSGDSGRRNVREAERITELIEAHIKTHPERSLGVITFSTGQQQAVSAAVQRFRETHTGGEYDAFFNEDREDAFFIKNLENVQGDERDTILFSIGYARTARQVAEGRPMSLRFGPLSLAGGERRLNVAITRARRNVKLVGSIKPEEIELSRTKSEGARLLRSYIEFAMRGATALPQATELPDRDAFADTVAELLRSRGYAVERNVGLSGYRVDIAVRYPSQTVELYAAGIECDGLTYHSAVTARDRDRLRGSVLTGMGWNMYRLWSTAWFTDPDGESERLLRFVEKAIAASAGRARAVEEEQARLEQLKRETEAREAKRAEAETAERVSRPRASGSRRRIGNIPLKRAENEVRPAPSIPLHEPLGPEADWVIPGATVANPSYGTGTVEARDDNTVTVRFGSQSRRYELATALRTGTLRRVEPQPERETEPIAPGSGPTAMIAELKEKGFACVYRPQQSLLLWVYYEPERRREFEQIAAKHRASVRLERHGSALTGQRPAWCITVGA